MPANLLRAGGGPPAKLRPGTESRNCVGTTIMMIGLALLFRKFCSLQWTHENENFETQKRPVAPPLARNLTVLFVRLPTVLFEVERKEW